MHQIHVHPANAGLSIVRNKFYGKKKNGASFGLRVARLN